MNAAQEKESEGRYWADRLAAEVIERRGSHHIVATGITPSGPIHLGNMREVLTGDASYRALRDAGADASLVYIADTFDPLRKLYPFLPSDFERYIGMPLYAIPDPEGCCRNYAEHYLTPFLAALDRLGVHPRVLRAHQMYKDGLYAEVTAQALDGAARIREIISRVSGRELPEDWIPFNPECSSCGTVSFTHVRSFDTAAGTVDYDCDCGHTGVADFRKGEGKLPWRIDWPARWKALGITVEPFGKDHAAAGGSYDTGAEIVREVFGGVPPEPVIYEWIYLKGKGAMASSTGVAVSIDDLLSVATPETIRGFVLRPRPEKHLDFDPAAVPAMFDEYQEFEEAYHELGEKDGEADRWTRRVYEMSQAAPPPYAVHARVPFIHLTVATQTARHDPGKLREVLVRSGYDLSHMDDSELNALMGMVERWLEKYAPEAFKFHVSEALPEEAATLTDEQRSYLAICADALAEVPWDPADVHDAVHGASKTAGVSAKTAFQAVYLAILGKKGGPRAGYFISSLDREFVVDRLRQAAAGMPIAKGE